MSNLTRRARRRRRAILADQLAASLTTARIGWSRTDRDVARPAAAPPSSVASTPCPEEPVVANEGAAPPAAPLPARLQAPATVHRLPSAWLITSAAVGRARARRAAAAARVAALPAPRRGWPESLDQVAAAVGLACEGWSGHKCRLADPVLGSILITVAARRGGWEHQVYERDRGGWGDEPDITDEVPDLWFGDLFEQVDDLGEAAVWASMARTLRLVEGVWQVTVELDVDLDDRVPDLELASAVAQAVVAEALPTMAPVPGKRRRPWRRR